MAFSVGGTFGLRLKKSLCISPNKNATVWWRKLSGIFIPGWLSMHRDKSFLCNCWATLQRETRCRLWKHFPRQWCVAFFTCKLWWTLMMGHCLRSFTWMHSGRCSRWMRNKGPRAVFHCVLLVLDKKNPLLFQRDNSPKQKGSRTARVVCVTYMKRLTWFKVFTECGSASFALLGLLLKNISFTLQASHPPRSYVMMLQNWTFRTC